MILTKKSNLALAAFIMLSFSTCPAQVSKPQLSTSRRVVSFLGHGTLAASSALTLFISGYLSDGKDAAVVVFIGGIPGTYGLYRGVRGMYKAVVTEEKQTQQDTQNSVQN